MTQDASALKRSLRTRLAPVGEGPSVLRPSSFVFHRTLRLWLGATAGLALVFGLWEGVVRLAEVPLYVLPAPSAIWQQLVRDWPLLVRHAQPTIIEAAGGFALGNGAAIALATLFVHFGSVRRSLFPVAIALRTVPLVAITPLLLVWLGNGYAPKIVIAGLISFFPTLVNMTRGLDALDPRTLDLLRTLSAGRWQVFVKARWPSSLPYLFSALKIAATSSVLGAVIAEWIGSDKGLGYLVVASTFDFKIARLWATIALTSAIALAGFLLVVLAERLLVPWRDETTTPP
ncbi:MAG: ABC transporter permease [Chloroflexi bacterium]|nr:ABC transporter permease [Chloroflexota bacterium]